MSRSKPHRNEAGEEQRRGGRHRRRHDDELSPEEELAAELRGELHDTPADRARRGRRWLAIAAVVFAVVVLPRFVGPESGASASDPALPTSPPPGSTSSDASGGRGPGPSALADSPSPGRSSDGSAAEPGRPGTGASGRTSVPAPGQGPTGPPDGPRDGSPDRSQSAKAAFGSVRAGQCLSVHRRDDGTGWTATAPTAAVRVSCAARNAYVRVSAVRDDSADCPAGDGRGHWSGPAGDRPVSLCLTRQFRQGDCLLAAPKQDGRGVRADLMSAPDCGLRALTEPYDRVLAITSIHPGAPQPVPQGFCAYESGDRTQYWTWRVGDDTVLCAAEAT